MHGPFSKILGAPGPPPGPPGSTPLGGPHRRHRNCGGEESAELSISETANDFINNIEKESICKRI